jgi:LysM repeat protein
VARVSGIVIDGSSIETELADVGPGNLMKKRIVLPILLAALVMSLPAHAQTDCAAHINAVIASLANVCANLDAGQACVAHERVVATVEGPPAAISFSQPDDRAAFTNIRNMQTSPFDAFTGAWGVALIRPSAGPSTLLMAGAVQLDNHSTAPDSLDIGVLTDTASEPGCAEALPGFTVYVPAGSRLDLTLNGAGMALDGALVTARQQTPNSLTLAVFQGQVTVSGGPVAGAGQTLVAVTDNAGTIAFWSAPRLHTEQETRQATIVSGALDAMLHTGMVASACAQPIIHVVQRGEWIYSIARQYGVSPQAILDANALQDPNLLYAGQELVIPCAEGQPALASAVPVEQAAARDVFICPDSPRHRVARGETLYGIAVRYGVPVDDIAAANRLVSPGVIYEGQELIIPCGVDSGATAPAPADAEQPEDTPAQPPNEDSSPPADFCQQDFSSAPPDLQQFISSLCNP